MMEDNRTIFNYISQFFAIYGMIVMIFIIFGILIGDSASGYSSLFELGNQGFSTSTLLPNYSFLHLSFPLHKLRSLRING